MKRFLPEYIFALIGVAGAVLYAATETTDGGRHMTPTPVSIASAIDDRWILAVPDASAATAQPYQPAVLAGAEASPELVFSANGYMHLAVVCAYPRGETLTTDPIICVWVRKGGVWTAALDVNGRQLVTLADSASDADDGTATKRTKPVFFDLQGAADWIITVQTAANGSGSGTLTIEASRF